MLVMVTFAVDKRFRLVEIGRIGKLRGSLSLPLRTLISVYLEGTELPFVATNGHANKMTSGEGGGDPCDFFLWPKCTAFED
jgi:hypothetical protein